MSLKALEADVENFSGLLLECECLETCQSRSYHLKKDDKKKFFNGNFSKYSKKALTVTLPSKTMFNLIPSLNIFCTDLRMLALADLRNMPSAFNPETKRNISMKI